MSSNFTVANTWWVPHPWRPNASTTGTFSASWRIQHTENEKRIKKNTSIGGFRLLNLDAILFWNIFVWSLPPLKIECENTTLYLTFPKQWQIYPSHPKWLKLLQLLESFWRYSLTPNPFSGFDISYVPSLHSVHITWKGHHFTRYR